MRQLFYLFKRSAKKWKNMEQLTDIIDEHVLKPTKACGTRWIGHRLLAVKALDRDYKTLRMLFDDLGSGEREDTTATVSATMKGRIKDLKTHKFALYLAVYQDLLQELSVLSNRFQAEDIPITSVRASVEVAALALKAQLETPGTHVQKFEREVQEANTDSDTEDGDNQTKRLKYRDLELYGPRVPSVEEFQAGPLKTVVDKVIDCLDKRFNEFYENEVLIAFEVFDPSNMPKGKDTLAAYGNAKVTYLSNHFQQIIERNGCDPSQIQREWLSLKLDISRNHGEESNFLRLWKTILTEKGHKYPNILHLVQICLVCPVATSHVERQFSAVKRILGDWRLKLGLGMQEHLLRISTEGSDPDDFDSTRSIARWHSMSAFGRRPDTTPLSPKGD
uniref:uncharacterized protein n=1 Tax=Myxine glutinosa TaxID=7769 RepID=UPI00358ED6B1